MAVVDCCTLNECTVTYLLFGVTLSLHLGGCLAKTVHNAHVK